MRSRKNKVFGDKQFKDILFTCTDTRCVARNDCAMYVITLSPILRFSYYLDDPIKKVDSVQMEHYSEMILKNNRF